MPHREGGNSDQIAKNEASETRMWACIAAHMPQLEVLNIKLTIQGYVDLIMPPFDDYSESDDKNTYYTIEQLDNIHWLQPLKAFCALKDSLRGVRVDLWDDPEAHMRATIFMGYKYYKAVYQASGQSFGDAQGEVSGKWCCFYKALYGSMGRAIRNIIMGKEDPWAEHLVVLTKFEMFKRDQHGSTGLFTNERKEARAVHGVIYDDCKRRRGRCPHGH